MAKQDYDAKRAAYNTDVATLAQAVASVNQAAQIPLLPVGT